MRIVKRLEERAEVTRLGCATAIQEDQTARRFLAPRQVPEQAPELGEVDPVGSKAEIVRAAWPSQ